MEETTNENAAPSVSESAATNRDVEKQEEEKLKSKYPAGVGMKGPGGHSAFLQKRLQKGVSGFFSFLHTKVNCLLVKSLYIRMESCVGDLLSCFKLC